MITEHEMYNYRSVLPGYCRLLQDGLDDHRMEYEQMSNDIISRVKRLTTNSEFNDELAKGTIVCRADDA